MAGMIQSTQSQTTPNQILYLFTSTAAPYHDDTADLLELPGGLMYRFRYHQKYLPTNVKEKIQNNTYSKNVLLVHAITDNTVTPPGVLEYFPIREAEILKIKNLGDFFYFEFKLGDWVHYNSYTKDSQNPHHNTIVNKMPPEQKTQFPCTVILGEHHNLSTLKENLTDDYENSDSIKSWSNLVSYLMDTDSHKNTIFLKLLSVEKIDNVDKSTKLEPKELGNNLFGFEFDKDVTYRIEVLQRTVNNPDPKFDLEISTKPGEILILEKTAKVQGKYDILHFLVSAERLERTRRSFFILQPEKISKNSQNNDEKYTISKSRYDVKINVGSTRKYVSFIVLVTGLIISGTAVQWVPPELSSLVSFASAGGAVLSALGVYLLPRR